MKKSILTFAVALVTFGAIAQKKTTTSAIITFDATTSIDNLPKAENKTAIAAIDPAKGTVQFEASIKNFAFTNPMIQDHFNGEKWLNSGEFPKATFNGTIVNLSDVNFTKDGTYTANVEGILTIRGKEGKVKSPATIVVKNGAISATSNFSIKLSDYGIEGAPINAGKVAKEPVITVTAELK